MKRNSRNINVEKAVNSIIQAVDSFIEGAELNDIPQKEVRDKLDSHFSKNGGSVKVASVFLLSYSLEDDDWDTTSVPVGTRGKYGDKLLAAELTNRYVTFHNNITAFGENLGWKGNVSNIDLTKDPRFVGFIEFFSLGKDNKESIFKYICNLLAESRVVPKAIPKLPANHLTYARSVSLFSQLVAIQSEGHIQQFLVAAILQHHRSRYGIEVATHHPHASDKFDNTYGDIEEFLDGTLINAYEVTVRPDWKNRIPDLRSKMLDAGLQKYVLIASDVNSDDELSSPKLLIDFTEKAGFDLAIVDLSDFIKVFCSELRAGEIRDVLNTCYEFLLNPKLCGRHDISSAYRQQVDTWIDS